jgi:hypothetical protein
MSSTFLKLIIFYYTLTLFLCHGMSEDEISQSVEEKIVTCGSAIRIQNVMTKFRYLLF